MKLPQRRYLVILLAGLSAPALAQQTADGAIARVDVKGAAYDPRRDDTASKFLIGREEIERHGDASVFDVFKRIPGVTVTTGSGRSMEVRMRGLGGGYTQVLVNGVRAPAGFTLDSLPPEMIERIEVLRTATAEFSTESVAGTINLVLRKKVRKREREAKLGYLLSEDFRGPTFSTQLADRGERSSWSFVASGNHDGLSRTWTGYQLNTRPDGVVDLDRATATGENGRMNRLNLAPQFKWTLENGDSLEWESLVNGSSFRNAADGLVTTSIGSAPPVPDLHTYGKFDDRMLKSDLRWSRALASGAKFETKLGVERTRAQTLVRRTGFDAAGRLATHGSVGTGTRAKGATSTGKFARQAGARHVLAIGWDAGFNESQDLRTERDAVRVLPPGQPEVETFAARVLRAAAYAQDEWTVTPRWSVYLGARWEGVRTHVNGNTIAPTRVRSSVLSPIVQSLWKLADEKGEQTGHQFRLAVSRTYKAPDLYSLVPRRAEWENNSPTEADYQGNPALKPELAWGVDAAWEHYWAQGAMVSASTALRRIDNYTSNRIYFDGLRWIYTPFNEDRALMRSLDLETKFPLSALGDGLPAIDLRASVSRNWSRVASVPGPHNRAEQQTPLSANLGIDYQKGALSAGASLAHRRGGPVRVAANRGFYSHARTDLETYAVWKFTLKLQLRVALSNLLGEDNFFEPSYSDPAGGIEKRGWLYPEGVKLRTTLEMTL
ncbi:MULTISPECIES: TonB-dependent siderophore receptor [unclassified Massilia]|uniref:TonB-dependent receptor plug domain-containing protein n=1 Tax=unclassified Massilia TaxID=2609279 RepID=UPI00177F1419|nr:MULTISPECIES: TonB-dependent receptor [unclassified Massilia]MBD8530171.1 TonB-dependent receptor [Massilia sp. CFBP 13647]MBD8674000.1 TonB-dependent receptor [Massilia sp. CFBP 13721]